MVCLVPRVADIEICCDQRRTEGSSGDAADHDVSDPGLVELLKQAKRVELDVSGQGSPLDRAPEATSTRS
jgi:hypothetical protein